MTRSLLVACLVWSFGSACLAEEPSIVVAEPTEVALQQAFGEVAKLREQGTTAHVTITLPAGTYRLTKTLEIDSKLVAEGMTLEPADTGDVVFSGAQQLKATSRDAEGRWHYPLPEGWQAPSAPRAILVDGHQRTAARTPNEGYFRIVEPLPDRRSGFVYQADDLPGDLPLTGHVCDLVLLHDWSSSRLPVQSIDAEAKVLKTVGPIGADAPHYAIDHFEKQPRYYLEGHAAFADQPGEWYVDPVGGELVVVATGDTAPVVELPLLEQLLVARGTDEAPITKLVLQQIKFTGSRFQMPPGGMACVQAANMQPRNAQGEMISQGRQSLPSAVTIEVAKHCTIKSCKFTAMGNSGLCLGSRTTDCCIAKCTFTDIGGNAINLGEDNARQVNGQAWWQVAPEQVPAENVVVRCTIQRCGQILPGAVAIWGGFQQGLQVVQNDISDCPYTGISLGWMWNPTPTPAGNNVIAQNKITRVMQTLSDGGGIYTLGNQPNSHIDCNTISDVPLNLGRAESNGMFLDEGTTGFTIYFNSFRGIARSPIRFHKAGENVVTGNFWQLATPDTPPVRFNATPEANITIEGNRALQADQ